MKHTKPVLLLAFIMLGTFCIIRIFAADPAASARYEYATIHWDGKDNTHVIRPGGHVEFIGAELRKAPKPNQTDDRAFYMNLAMNGLTKEGYEFAGMTNDEIVMKRGMTK